jgi:hypothetical protein
MTQKFYYIHKSSASSTSQPIMDEFVKFDVGHSVYVCSKKVILQHPDSMLAKCIINSELTGLQDNYINIDRDGKYFSKVLDFLRDEKSLKLRSMDRYSIERLLEEAKYFCLDRLLQLCDDELVKRDSSMVSNFMIFDSKKELFEYIRTSTKLVILVSFERYILTKEGQSQLIECLPFLDSSKADVVGFTGQFDSADGIMILYDPKEDKPLMSLSEMNDKQHLSSLVHEANKF